MNNREILPYIYLEKPLLDYLHDKGILWLMYIERGGNAAPAERMLGGLDRACLEEIYRRPGPKFPGAVLKDMVIYRVSCAPGA